MHLTDFMGKQYGPGDTVVYSVTSGRCANLVVATVLDIRMVWFNCYAVGDRYGWETVPEDSKGVADLGSIPELVHDRPPQTGYRVKVLPIRGARWRQHTTDRAVTLTIPENIIKWEGELPDEVPDAVS